MGITQLQILAGELKPKAGFKVSNKLWLPEYSYEGVRTQDMVLPCTFCAAGQSICY